MTIATVDAFASVPFTGNPAAVCVLDAPASAAWMQALASEMNLSETAFLTPAGAAYDLRWFTPTVEVDLCGHATLAAAHLLYESGRVRPGAGARFETKSGRLAVWMEEPGRYVMDFPATPPEAGEVPKGFEDVFRVSPVWTGRSQFDLFAELDCEAAVRALDPDAQAVAALGARGVILSARADAGAPYDVVSRFFAPAVGVDEDPVTGSAHCTIGPYWAGVLGTDTVECHQASARGGRVGVRVLGERVELTGQAITMYRGALSPAAHPPAA